MAEDTAPMASAGVLQEADHEQPGTPRAIKRRQSSSPDPSIKRPRLSTDGDLDSPPTLRASPNASLTVADPAPLAPKEAGLGRRESNAQEERKRGRRLFGGLLNTLSQSTSNAQQKKRLEIEKRQQEKARLQKAEDELRRAEKLQKLREVRMREQVKFDEQSMRIRHSNMLAMAQFLRTKAEPKLYYKPWELLPGDAERIREQIADAEALIEREVREFNRRHKAESSSSSSSPPPPPPPAEERPAAEEGANNRAAETEGEHRAVPSPVPPVAESESTNPLRTAQAQLPESSHVRPSAERDALEENGEVVVEGDEDTVIY